MSCNSILFILVALSNVLVSFAVELRTALAIKETSNNRNPIAINAVDFKELIVNSNVFIDKTLLIKEILSGPSIVLINCPRSWGKSINLDMIKTFFEIQVDGNGRIIEPHENTTNYRLFVNGEITIDNKVQKLKAPLLIANHTDLIETYQGKHPVIYFDLAGIASENFDQFIYHIKLKISELYQQHHYLRSVLERKLAKSGAPKERKELSHEILLFDDIVRCKQNRRDTKYSLRFLGALLHEHFAKGIFVLVNDYDSILHKVLLDRGIKHFNDMKEFLGDILKKTFDDNQFLEKGILIGTVDITNEFHGLESVPHFDFFNNDLYEFFGVNGGEIDMLFDHLEISAEKRQLVDSWYNGYKAGKNAYLSVYHAHAVSQFLMSKNILNHWLEIRGVDMLINELLLIELYRNIFYAILTGEDWFVSLGTLKFYLTDFQDLQDSLNHPNPKKPHDLVFQYFFSIGYFTFIEDADGNQRHLGNTYRLRYANKQISKTVKKKLLDHYEMKLGVRSKKFKLSVPAYQESFVEFVDNDNQTSKKLETSLEAVLKHFPPFDASGCVVRADKPNVKQNRFLRLNANIINTLMEFLTLHVESYTKFRCSKLVLQKDDRLIVFHGEYKVKSAKGALVQAKQYTSRISIPEKIKEIKFIGINIRPDKTVEILTKTETKSEVNEFHAKSAKGMSTVQAEQFASGVSIPEKTKKIKFVGVIMKPNKTTEISNSTRTKMELVVNKFHAKSTKGTLRHAKKFTSSISISKKTKKIKFRGTDSRLIKTIEASTGTEMKSVVNKFHVKSAEGRALAQVKKFTSSILTSKKIKKIKFQGGIKPNKTAKISTRSET